MTVTFNFVYRHRIRLLVLLAGLVTIDVVWVAGTYLVYPGYLDHGESIVAMTSWRLFQGFAIYPPFDGPDRTMNIYGPVASLMHAAVYALAGQGVASSKAAGLAATLLLPVVVFFTHKPRGFGAALAAAILAAGLILVGIPFTIWNRPDPMMMLLVAVAVWTMRAPGGSDDGNPGWGKDLVIALSGGLAVGLKVHAGLYFMPVVLVHCWGRGLRPFFFIAAVSAAVTFAPFLFEPFSLADYLSWFPLVGEKPFSFAVFIKVLRYGLFYLSPVLFFTAALQWANGAVSRVEWVYFLSFLACVAVVVVPASKPGAGWYYMAPFLAISVDMIVRYSSLVTRNKTFVRAGCAVLAAALLVISVPVQKRFFRALHWQTSEKITLDLNNIIGAYPTKSIQMGVGDSIPGYNTTFYRPLLVFAGHPFTLDVGVMIELSKMRVSLHKGTLRRLETCHTDVWLVPKGERPFALIGYYGNRVFDDTFRNTFMGNYEKQKRFTYFDAWVCKE